MAYAKGSKAWGTSDRSGFRYRLKDMKREWNGLLVGPDEFEEKHPQLRAPRPGPDPQALRNPRPSEREPLTIIVGGPTVEAPRLERPRAVGAVGQVTIEIVQSVTVQVTGRSASGAVGTATVGISFIVPVTGVSATGAVGTADVTGSAAVSATGVSATGAVGTADVTGSAAVSATGVSATGAVGTASSSIAVDAPVSGVSATGTAGATEVFVPFTPASLSDLVVWADIHPDYCYQDDAGTTPAGVGDPVGYLTDRSGNGYHLTQATSTARPTLKQTAGGKYYLDGDGVDDHLLLPAAATSGTTVLDTVLGFEADATINSIFAVGDGPTNYLYPAVFVNGQLRVAAEVDPDGSDVRVNTAALSTATPYVWRALRDGTDLAANLNGVSQGTITGAGTGGLANFGFALGARNNGGTILSFFDGKVFGLVVVNRAMTSTEIADLEAFMAEKSGVTL